MSGACAFEFNAQNIACLKSNEKKQSKEGDKDALNPADRSRRPAFGATLTFKTTDANAVVCARGVYRAGCAGVNGAVVVRRPVAACRSVLVNGVGVRRCV